MSVAPQSLVSAQRRRSRKLAVASQPKQRGTVPETRPHTSPSLLQPTVPLTTSDRRGSKLPNFGQSPLWWRSLLFVQRSSSVISFLLIGIVLAVYASTVYTQQQWSREYHKLATLQRHERQMTAANELLKNQLATLAESPNTGLVLPTAASTIFLPEVTQRQLPVMPAPATAKPKASASIPLGY